ncbi:hypothetical protein [Persicitalea jodogahamensis]|uniref:Uncharacterized protein n=1 Tax=Persicitalea jodogahamensis TaxID=402147 RepID=A0A8J3GB97_9BACT|nr:hypothetical protein [Persicitalea jodogahamensis]GHB88850.1 hypothetical protein GCM10007390_51190 [Persicitalea jodogahamensis]
MEELTEEELARILENLNGHTPKAEALAFRERRKTDPGWDAKVREVEEMQYQHRYIQARKELEKIWRKDSVTPEVEPEPLPVPVRSLWQRPQTWLAAASVVLLLGFGIWFALNSSLDSGDQAGNNQNPPLDTFPQNGTVLPEFTASDAAAYHIAQVPQFENVPPKLADQALAIAIDVQRQQALAELQKMKAVGPAKPSDGPLYGSGQEDTTPDNTLSAREESYRQLLLGIGYLKEKKVPEALQVLGLVKDKSLTQEAHWYKALAYLQTNQNDSARRELKQITDSRYLVDATELLEKLQ